MPVDVIKIDLSFDARLSPGDPSAAILGGLIAICRELDIRVVAEGIETDVQTKQLKVMGCTLGLGFAFSKAVDRAIASELLRVHRQAQRAVPLPARAESKAQRSRSA